MFILSFLLKDEFAHLGKRAKEAFRENLMRFSGPDHCEPIIVDRINTMKMHRKDVFGSMRSIGQRVVVVWDMSVKDCISRVRSRGAAHKSIKPSDNAAMIVGRTNKDMEPISQEEVETYHIRKIIHISDPMSMTRAEVIRTIIAGLIELVPEFATINDLDIDKAVEVTLERERTIAADNVKSSRGRDMASRQPKKSVPRRGRDRVDPGKSDSLSIAEEGRYQISLDQNGRFKELFELWNDASGFELKSEFHVTLLFMKRPLVNYINGDSERFEKASGDGSSVVYAVDEYRAAVAAYQSIGDEEIRIRILYVARNDRVMAARVEIENDSVRFFDVIPHVSISKTKDAQFRESNDLIRAVDERRRQGQDPTHEPTRVFWKDVESDNICFGKVEFKLHGS